MKPVFIIAIVAVAMIGVMVPSGFAGHATYEEALSCKADINSKLNQPLNAPISLEDYKNEVFDVATDCVKNKLHQITDSCNVVNNSMYIIKSIQELEELGKTEHIAEKRAKLTIAKMTCSLETQEKMFSITSKFGVLKTQYENRILAEQQEYQEFVDYNKGRLTWVTDCSEKGKIVIDNIKEYADDGITLKNIDSYNYQILDDKLNPIINEIAYTGEIILIYQEYPRAKYIQMSGDKGLDERRDICSNYFAIGFDSPQSILIPDWIRNTAGWWADGNVRDNDFVNGIGFLIKNGIISLPIIESTEGVSEKNILNLLQDTWPNEFHEISFSGIVVPRPVMPIDVTLIDPDGIITKSETYADGEGNYSIIFKFDRNSKTGIYHVNMHHWDKLVNSDSFKLEKFSVKTKIPTWIKNNAGWWADGTIDDDAFIQGIQYLVKNRILIVEDNSISSSNEKNLPSSKYKETHIEGFPDPLKTPKYYLDRYYGEENYRKWFDEQFSNITIYEILGLISNSDEIIKYIVPSAEFSKSYGIDKHKTKYLNELTSSELVTGIETNYSTKSGNVGITIYKMSTQNFANELFNSLSKDTDLNSISQFEKYYFQEVICLAERLSPQICVYDKYLIFTDLYWGSTGDPDRKIGIIIVDKTLQNISMIENKNYESQIAPISVNWDNQSVLSLFTPFTDMGIVNLGMMSDPINSDLEPEVKSTEGFHGLYCQQDEYGYVEMTGQYTNGPEAYSSIYFKFGVLDYQDRIVSTGIGSISNVAPYQTKMFDARAEWSGNFKECIIEVDTAFR